MAQKTNPTALRLEKTNQHYISCWYSDKFYAQQLHKDYSLCNYITKVFHKIKKAPTFLKVGFQQITTTKPLIYAKAGHEINQVFCIFPKFANKYPRKKASTRKKENLSLSCLRQKVNSLFYASAAYKDERVRIKDYVKTTTKWPGRSPERKTALYSDTVKLSRLSKPFLRPQSSHNMESLSPLVRALFHKWHCQKEDLKHSKFSSPMYFPFKDHLEQTIENSDLRAFTQRHFLAEQFSTNLRFVKDLLGENKERVLVSKAKEKQQKASFSLPLTRLAQETERQGCIRDGGNKRLKLNSQKSVRLYLIKVGFASQNSQFLAQRICNNLKNRFTFPRLRRQILWDIKKSRWVKGIRVILKGRTESKSKKAQKARSRTFQWGQTNLHVFSSLVQFTSRDLITPRGKIGVKVWICYGE